MMRLTKSKTLTDFLRNSKGHIEELSSSGEAEILTVNGEASVVVQDIKSYQALLELAELARQDERLYQSLQSARNCEPAESASKVFSRLRDKHAKTS